MNKTIENYVELPVTGGYVTKVDPDISEKLKGKRVFIQKARKFLYPAISLNAKIVYLHRYIMKPEKDLVVDHISGDTFDNRRSNLRNCTISENLCNIHYPIKSKTGFRNVYIRNRRQPFLVNFSFKNKTFYVGYYSNVFIASIFRDFAFEKKHNSKIGLIYENEISLENIKTFLDKTSGKIFRIIFAKRNDGSCRSMICRTGVSKNINGKGMSFNPYDKNLYVVFDMHSKSYKCIPLENVICIYFSGIKYLIKKARLKSAS